MKRRSVKKPHQTAIKRGMMSLPATYLLQRDLLKGRVLDYGCGRGDDVRCLNKVLGVHDWSAVVGYDPHWQPHMPDELFDTVICTYVLNVILDGDERVAVIENVLAKLKPDGHAYITVRRDITSDTSSQRVVELDEVTLVHAKGKFEIYHLHKES
jgi:2-polyprenyl-3-methyl-5-hydroxy-6-metoxy-1,4-benzoquinol methylase